MQIQSPNKSITPITQLKSTDIKPLKEKWYEEQQGVCPILKKN